MVNLKYVSACLGAILLTVFTTSTAWAQSVSNAQVSGVVRRQARRSQDVLEEAERATPADPLGPDRSAGEAREVARRERSVERDGVEERTASCVVEDVVDDPGGLDGHRVHGCGRLRFGVALVVDGALRGERRLRHPDPFVGV